MLVDGEGDAEEDARAVARRVGARGRRAAASVRAIERAIEQLEEEIEHPHAPQMSWLMLDYDEKLVFGQLEDSKPDDIWEDCVSRAVKNKTAEITSRLFKD